MTSDGIYEKFGTVETYELMPNDEIGYVFIGPSGVGKSTLRDVLCNDSNPGELSFTKFLPFTTRKQRPEEENEYRYISAEDMERLKKSPHTLFGNISYGNEFLTPWPERLSENNKYIYIYLPEAAIKLKSFFPNTKIIQILPDGNDVLESRILSRDPDITPEEIRARISSASAELDDGAQIADAQVVNNAQFSDTVEQLKMIMLNFARQEI